MSLRRLAAELSDFLQNTTCCLEVDPSKALWAGWDRDTLGGMGLEGVWGNIAVWQGEGIEEEVR